MATYPVMTLTSLGQALYAKVQTGTTLTFTRFQIGGGEFATSATTSAALNSGTAYTSISVNALTGAIASGSTLTIGSDTVTTSAQANIGDTSISVNSYTPSATYASGTTVTVTTQNTQALTALITPIGYFSINSIADTSGTATIRGIYQNTSLAVSTYTCEIGLFAQDPTAGEILYGYANAGALGDTIPPYADGPFSRSYTISAGVGNATSVTATIPTDTYVTVSEVGVAGGVASLDGTGNVPASQLGNATVSAATTTSLGTVEVAQDPASGDPIAVITNPTGGNTQTVSGIVGAWAFQPVGFTGATAASRYAGGTTSGAPTTGTFAVGDYVVDQSGAFWVCTTAGTPGTWARSTATMQSARNVEVTSTTAQTILSFTPTFSSIYSLKSYLRVVTAATTITLTIVYADSGGAQSYTPPALNAQSIAVGSHGVIAYDFEAVAGTAITLTITAGTANQVYATASLVEVA